MDTLRAHWSFVLLGLLHILLVQADLVVYDYVQHADALRYLAVADEFARGIWSDGDPALHCTTAPGYPLFLAAIKPLTGHHPQLIALVQSVLFLTALFFVVKVLLRNGTFTPMLAVLGVALAVVSPEMHGCNGWTLSGSLSASMVLVVMGVLFTPAAQQGRNALLVVAMTVLVITKFEYVLLVPVVLFWCWRTGRRWTSVSLVIALAFALLANGFRNAAIFGPFQASGFGSGTVIYGGNNLNGDGSWHSPQGHPGYLPAQHLEAFRHITGLDPRTSCLEQDRFYKALALEAWRTDPWLQLTIIPLKFLKLWVLPATMDHHTGLSESRPGLRLGLLFNDALWPWYAKYKHGFYLVVHWCYLVLILLGLRRRWSDVWTFGPVQYALVLAMLVSVLFSVPFYGLGRFHLPVFTPLILLAAFALEGGAQRSRLLARLAQGVGSAAR